MDFNILRHVVFIILSPTCFGGYDDHLQGDVLITTFPKHKCGHLCHHHYIIIKII